ncbi:arsenical pump membrane protein-domain-containing protein [Dissophora ornata]|nr:arsenical pump membrane protein-domain-containing protein [Dissophora ornata]
MAPSDRSLDAHSWLVVITFMIVIVIVIHPIRIPFPIPSRQKTKFPYHFTLDIATAPVIGVLFLLATGSIDGESVQDGIIGEPTSGIEPYAVMILFFSLAYICISLDMTGALQYAAFWISKRGGGGGQRIFLYFFLLSTIMSGLTSNDVVILTMTPFLVYFSRAVDLHTPVAFLMAEVQTANIASMALYIGNLTNVVACQAYKVSFLEYSAWMLIPTVFSVAACYIMLRINFRNEKYIPKTVKSPDVDPRSCLIDPFGAIFGLCVLACSLICLIGTSFAHVSVWTVTGPFALLTLCRDILYDYQGKFKGLQAASLIQPDKGTAGEDDVTAAKGPHETGGVESRIEQGLPEDSLANERCALPSQQNTGATATATNIEESALKPRKMHRKIKGPISKFERRFPLLHAIAIRMPWAILPFTFSMFIMVEGLSDSGWIAIFANWATKLVPNYIVATYAIGFVSVLLCNIFNNVPMTILVARILQHPNFVNSPLATPEVVKGCLFALVVGSNLGACTTLISSLAGLMWDSVLRSKNSGVGFWNFFKWNMGVMPMVIFTALSVVVVELTVVYR